MNFNRAISFIFDDPEWLKKIAIAALISLIPIVGVFVLLGWALEISRRVIKNELETLPEFSDFGALMSNGFKVFLVQLGYFSPLILFFVCAWGLSFAGLFGMSENGDFSSNDMASGIFGVVMFCVWCISLPILFLAGIMAQAARGRLAATGELGQAFKFKEVMATVKAGFGKYILSFLLVMVAAMILSPIGTLLCGVGALFTSAMISAFDAHLVGQVYKLANPEGAAAAGVVEIL
jgi:hypothetical protein